VDLKNLQAFFVRIEVGGVLFACQAPYIQVICYKFRPFLEGPLLLKDRCLEGVLTDS